MADDSNDYNSTADLENDEDARSDVTYFELDAVEEVTEVVDVKVQKETPKKQESVAQEEDEYVSDESELSDEEPEIAGVEVKENCCRLCLTECNETAAEMADFVDYYTFCTSYCIYADDVPKKICDGCKCMLTQIFEFKRKCKRIEFVIKKVAKEMEIQIDFEEPSFDETSRPHSTRKLSYDSDDPAVKAQIQMCYEKRVIGRPRKNPDALAKPYPLPGRAIGRPRVEKPVLPKRPLGRPRGSTKPRPEIEQIKRKPGRPESFITANDLVPRGRIGRPPGSKNKKSLSISDTEEVQPLVTSPSTKRSKYTKSIGEGLDVLRGDLPSEAGKHGKRGPRPDFQKYQAENDRILCPKCGRVFLESERKIMYNHMHKHRVEERRAAAEAAAMKKEKTEATDYSQPAKVEYIVVEQPSPAHSPAASNQNSTQEMQPTHQVYYRAHWT